MWFVHILNLLKGVSLAGFLTIPESNKNEGKVNDIEGNRRPEDMTSLYDNFTYVNNNQETIEALINSIELDFTSE